MNSDHRGRGSGGVNGRQRAAPPERNGATARSERSEQTPAMVSFDQTFTQLEETVAALEAGQLDLNDAVDLFERGMRLAQLCQEILDRAELRVSQLVAASGAEDNDDDTVATIDFDDE